MTKRFEELILAIDAKKYAGGVLAKMDAVLRLNKHGHTRENVLVGLAYVARHITHTPARDIAIDAYSKRVRWR